MLPYDIKYPEPPQPEEPRFRCELCLFATDWYEEFDRHDLEHWEAD